jgi:hypothetical protein
MKITRRGGDAADVDDVAFGACPAVAVPRRFFGAAFFAAFFATFFAAVFGVFFAPFFVVRLAAVPAVVRGFLAVVDFVAMRCIYGVK